MADELLHVCSLENSKDRRLVLSLFKEVTNVAQLRKHVMSGDIQAALLKPAMIVDIFQVIIAAHKAVHLQNLNKIKTKTLHSEIIFNLSPTNSIKDAFSKFGLSDQCDCVLVALITPEDPNQKMKEICEYIQGIQVSLDELKLFSNENTIRKVYKIQEGEVGSLLESVVCRMAAKDCI